MLTSNDTTLGILAHVDAGKTTLTEAMLYLSGRINRLGRVDHGDSFLDNHSLERARGITIFSKQARFKLGERCFTLMDTPGHVDFSSEAERTLQVLDYAVLVISGTDGIQAHTETLWRLIGRYSLPCFIFVTKMDLPGTDRETLMESLRSAFGDGCVEFSGQGGELMEHVAMCGEAAMDSYLDTGAVSDEEIGALLLSRNLFPCFFGSGLRTDGVEELLKGLGKYTTPKLFGEDFAARVYKIARDPQGNRLSYIRCTGGSLRVRAALSYHDQKGEPLEEKVSQLRLYSGIKYDPADEISAGETCALLGLSETYPGQGLGAEGDSAPPALESVLSYRIILPEGVDAAQVLPKLMLLSQEDPQLHMAWNERLREISVRLMGRVQTEVLKSIIKERFDLDIGFDAGRILYRETIAGKVEGVGHFEPLRHYAEVHLIMEPLPQGSGLVLDSVCPEDELDRNWQRLILTHLQEKQHIGVLTGAPITDMKISLAAGKAHIKHTEGGDFREATYRAVRQGLMKAESVLLEPWFDFELSLPQEQIGRAISDVRSMSGSFSGPEEKDGLMCISGLAPVSEMNGYGEELAAYSRGRGRLRLRLNGYRPCHNAAAVISAAAYDSERDTDNTADSVFCSHGAGVTIKWDRVGEYMHLESVLKPKAPESGYARLHRSLDIDQRELDEIMEREFGPIRRPVYKAAVLNEAPAPSKPSYEKKEYVIVDGYNLIFAWDELRELAEDRLDLARGRLMDMLSNYSGFTKCQMVLVFDGFRTPGNPGSKSDYHNIHVAFTKDGETGDAYIERIASQVGKNYSVRVVTSDNLIRLSALRSGVLRCSSGEFKGEVEWVLSQIDRVLQKTNAMAHKVTFRDGIQ